ncbi:MAG: TIR domain-containing protein [Bacteroidetes bacterium]|nr:TIR domain-containing protein [Bacteroidota bacterium]
MGKSIFVSYKYSDSNVLALPNIEGITTVRHYVDEIATLLEDEDHIYKGEDDGEDLGTLEDSTIASKLGDKIFHSSVTIVLISKGMKSVFAVEKDQWIPWEVSYSLKEQSRDGGRSKTNAVLAVVLPDSFGSYSFFVEDNTCQYCHCRTLKTDFLFQILRDNMFNIKNPVYTDCENHLGSKPYSGYSSYIHTVKWADFKANINHNIDIATGIRANIDQYELTKTVK